MVGLYSAYIQGAFMQWLSNLTIRKKFLLLPFIATTLIIILGIIFLYGINSESRLLVMLTTENVPKLQKISSLSSKFSANNVAFISLLATALKDKLSESSFYRSGRKNIIALNQQIEDLNKFKNKFNLNEEQNKIHDYLLTNLIKYRDYMGNAVLMSSVDIDLVAEHTLRVNEAYSLANTDFLNFLAAVQRETEAEIIKAYDELNAFQIRSFIVLGIILLFTIIISLFLSRIFTIDLKILIARLKSLAAGNTSIGLPEEHRKDEFGDVNNAIRVFRHTLVMRDEAEKKLNKEIITRKKIEHSLRESEERFRTLYDDNPLILFTIDQNGKIHSINRRGATQIGFSSEELVGSSVLKLVVEEDREEALSLIRRCASTPGTRHQLTLRKSHKDGNVIWLRETGQAIRGRGNSLMLLACEDVTETHQLSRQLSYQATHDNLTGLVNRWEFERRLTFLLDDARIKKSEHILCYIDLDQFKIINDTYGHKIGDKLLTQLSHMLKQFVGPNDTLARLGGDEFAILLENCSLSSGWRSVNSLLKKIQEFRFPWKEHNFQISASIGIVQIDELSQDADTLLSDADTACYTAKDEGRNRIHVYSPDDKLLSERRGQMQWANEIPRALEENRFELFFQTIEPLNDGMPEKGLSFEILLRMRMRDGKLISPDQFFPAAERYNLSATLDKWVISNTFSSLQQLKSKTLHVSQCSINLSGMSLGNENLLEFILAEIEKNDIDPRSICFEITETAAITNLNRAAGFIEKLKEKGILFALDDFGTGLSSFAYLKQLAVDKLKIDGVFVKEIDTSPIQLAMVKSINDVGHVMGLQTIAEFVETPEILQKLKEIKVDYAQGYYIAKPRPLSELLN